MRSEFELATEVQRNREVQVRVNQLIANQEFKIPVHLALGHESIAVATAAAMSETDQILLNHRNIHYQIALGATDEELISEYRLAADGLAGGKFGSMNLTAPKNRNIYTSNILGNNLAVGLGVAQSGKMHSNDSVAWIVTGDGAIEEGIFYETLLAASSWKLPLVIIVENNRWSLGTEIQSRRNAIDIELLSKSMGLNYESLQGNDISTYFDLLRNCRKVAMAGIPVVVEVHLETLGGYFVEENKGRRYVNYHAGKATIQEISEVFVIVENNSDPVFVNNKYYSKVNSI